jgi:hypothetical protein
MASNPTQPGRSISSSPLSPGPGTKGDTRTWTDTPRAQWREGDGSIDWCLWLRIPIDLGCSRAPQSCGLALLQMVTCKHKHCSAAGAPTIPRRSWFLFSSGGGIHRRTRGAAGSGQPPPPTPTDYSEPAVHGSLDSSSMPPCTPTCIAGAMAWGCSCSCSRGFGGRWSRADTAHRVGRLNWTLAAGLDCGHTSRACVTGQFSLSIGARPPWSEQIKIGALA